MTRDLGDARYRQQYHFNATDILTKTSDTVLENVAGLVSPTLVAGVYRIFGSFRMTATVAQVYKYRYNFSGTASVGQQIVEFYADGANTVQASVMSVNSDATTNSRTLWLVQYDGVFTVTAEGVFSIQFAQNSSSANPAQFRAFSSLSIVQI